jgi:hypothetical protein
LVPQVLIPNDQWLAQRIATLEQQVKALSADRTEYTVDESGVCQAIEGNLQFDNKGNATGLGNVWGLASFKTGAWVRL